MALTENLILQKTKAHDLASVKNLNLWGSELCEVSIISHLPNLEVLALSVNRVTSIREICRCKLLKELYLRKNEISSLAEVYHLRELPNLQILWLSDNPCATHEKYRLFTIRCCPKLKQFDNTEVSPQERALAEQMTREEVLSLVAASGGGGGGAAGDGRRGSAPKVPTNYRPASPSALQQARAAQGQIGVAGQQQQQPQPPPIPSSGSPPVQQQQRQQPAQYVHQQPPPPPQVQHHSAAAPNVPPGAGVGGGGARGVSPSPGESRRTQKAIVTSIVTLLNELSVESLEYLQEEIDNKVRTARAKR